jgi:hypothetical protein
MAHRRLSCAHTLSATSIGRMVLTKCIRSIQTVATRHLHLRCVNWASIPVCKMPSTTPRGSGQRCVLLDAPLVLSGTNKMCGGKALARRGERLERLINPRPPPVIPIPHTFTPARIFQFAAVTFGGAAMANGLGGFGHQFAAFLRF